MSAREPKSAAELAAAFGRGAPSTPLAPVAPLTPPSTPASTLAPAKKAPAPRADKQAADKEPPAGARERHVYPVLEEVTVDALRDRVQATKKSQVTLLGEAIEVLTPAVLAPHLPARTTTSMPGARATAVVIKASNYKIRASAQQLEWIHAKHQELAPELSMRQFLGIALTRYLEKPA